MKNLVTILLLLTLSFIRLTAQEQTSIVPVDPETKLITYKEVVQQTGTKTELFNRAVEWINTNYKNPADVTRVRNPETGLIELIHRIELSYDDKGVSRSAGIVDYTLKFEFKESRYRYTITNFNLKQASRVPIEKWLDKADKTYSPQYENYLSQIDVFTKNLIESLKKGMEPPAVKKEDVW
jgi:hypothetical protein